MSVSIVLNQSNYEQWVKIYSNYMAMNPEQADKEFILETYIGNTVQEALNEEYSRSR